MTKALRLLGMLACWLLATAALAQQPFIVVASTTSTEQSGLFPQLLPAFEKDTGISVRVVAVGTGQALDIGRRGDADVVFVHDDVAGAYFLSEFHRGSYGGGSASCLYPVAIRLTMWLTHNYS